MHLEALQNLALRISGERNPDAVLRQIVTGLAEQSGSPKGLFQEYLPPEAGSCNYSITRSAARE